MWSKHDVSLMLEDMYTFDDIIPWYALIRNIKNEKLMSFYAKFEEKYMKLLPL
jgi:hypothetical protein